MRTIPSFAARAVVFVCLLCPLVVLSVDRPLSASEPIRIGAVLTVTGWGAFMGTPTKEAFEALTEDINKKGGVLGRQLELIVEDDKSNPTNAVIAATKLVRDRNVAILTGPTITDSGMAMIPVCEQEKTPFLVIGPVVSTLKKWTFIIGPGDTRSAQHFLEYAVKNMGGKRLALIHGTDNYGATAARVLSKEISRYPEASIVIEEKFELSDTNMVPQMTKIKAANPDVLMIYGAGTTGSVIAKNYKQLGMTTPVLGSSGMSIPEFAKMSGSIAEEHKWIMLGSNILAGEKYPESHPFRKVLYDPLKQALKRKFGQSKEPGVFHAGPFDGMRILVEALKQAGTDDRAALRDALEKVRIPDGFVGGFECTPEDHQGAKKDPFIPLIIKNGEWFPKEEF